MYLLHLLLNLGKYDKKHRKKLIDPSRCAFLKNYWNFYFATFSFVY